MRVAIVAGIVVEHDAISAAVVGQSEIAMNIPGVESVTVFAQHISRDLPCPSHTVTDPWSLARHEDFATADIIIFHWGIFYSLFDVITLVHSSPLQQCVVHFHNCTPRELVADDDHDVIDRSLAQMQHAIGLGVTFWTFSEFNAATLVDWGVATSDIHFVPFPIDVPSFDGAVRSPGPVQLLTVGRRVAAKGIHVLLEAIAQLDSGVRSGIHLRVAGSSRFSNLEYADQLAAIIAENGLGEAVEFVDEPSDEGLWDLYRSSDIVISASFHEGLCVPIIEGYAFGLRAIGTTSGNLAYVVQDPDPCVPAGDVDALATAIQTVAAEVSSQPARHRVHHELVDRYSVATSRSILQRELYRLAASAS